MTTNSFIILAIAAAAAIIALFFLMRGRSKSPPGSMAEGNGVLDGAAAALEDVAGPLFGVDAHPDLAGPPDNLTILKGLGPKAAAQLQALGVTRYVHLAALTQAQVAAVDVRMGAFQGRITRDKWVEQAAFLARGDNEGFEAKFGKLMS